MKAPNPNWLEHPKKRKLKLVKSKNENNNSLELDINTGNPYRAKDGKYTTGPSGKVDGGDGSGPGISSSLDVGKKIFNIPNDYIYHGTSANIEAIKSHGLKQSESELFYDEGGAVYFSKTQGGNGVGDTSLVLRAKASELIDKFGAAETEPDEAGQWVSPKQGDIPDKYFSKRGLTSSRDMEDELQLPHTTPPSMLEFYNRSANRWEKLSSNNLETADNGGRGYNPNRTKDGKFTFGPTGSDSSLVSIINTSSTTIQKLNDDLTDLKKDAAGLEQKRFGLDTNSKESKDLEKLHDKNIDLQYETLGKITKARANLKTHVDNYFASEGIEPITLEQKVKQWGDGEWMDSIGPTIAKKPTADMFSKTEVNSMKKLNAQLYPSLVTVYRGMSVSPETKSITFKKNEIVSFSDSKRAAERFGKAKFDDRSLGITISKKIKPSEIIISHKWGSAYSSQVSMNAEIAVSFDAETKIDISKNEFDKEK